MKKAAAMSGKDSPATGVPSEPRRLGRRLVLKFLSEEMPDLDRIEFHANTADKFEYRQLAGDDKRRRFKAAKVSKALAVFFLDHLCARLKQPPKYYLLEGGDGTLATALGNALANLNGKWGSLFVEFLSTGGKANRVNAIFGGKNWGGKPAKRQIVFVKPGYLPPDCFEIFWHERQLKTATEIQHLTNRFHKAWNLPPPSELDLPEEPERGEETTPSVEAPPAPPAKKMTPAKGKGKAPEFRRRKPAPPAAPAKKTSPPKTATELFGRKSAAPTSEPEPQSESLPQEPKLQPTPKESEAQPQKPQAQSAEPKDQPQAPKEPKAKTEPASGTPNWIWGDATRREFEFEFKKAAPAPEPETASSPKASQAKIDPRLFRIENPQGLEWHDDDPLINFGSEDSEADVWRIRDASEGLLIFGAVGSGKTSGSGSAIGTMLLQAGYGGLVLTAKTDEAARWLRLCERTGRRQDCIHITQDSGHKLNILQYETQRPGRRPSITDDLVALFRCVIGVTSRSAQNNKGDDFWTVAPDRLMARLFDIFILSGEPFTLDALIQFVECAPTDVNIPWERIEYFADVIKRAKAAAEKGSNDDRDDFRKAFQYWTRAYPATTEVTRSGIITGFTAMADVLNGRGIREIIGSETNITPEQILSGKIVIVDFPVKESAKGGLMVQAAWKLLFQQAIERRADKGLSTARPVFLWEDEGHEFFSQHDVRFQPTARDCRASHVIMSQNIHNFLNLGHDAHAVYAVFAAMNTYIFHTNGDHETNSWASERIGEERSWKLKSGGLYHDTPKESLTFFENQRPDQMKHIGGFTAGEERKRAVPPEDFGRLKRGGDGTCQAIIYWLSHQFAANQGKNYNRIWFEQEQRQ